jgi:NADH dehydrogenase
LIKTLRGDARPYRYRSLGQGATLGRRKGIAIVSGIGVRGLMASAIVRCYHLAQVPQLSRAFRILADNVLSILFGRDYVALPGIAVPPAESPQEPFERRVKITA